MKTPFFVCSALLALSACATDPGWTGYRVNTKVVDGREQVRIDYREGAMKGFGRGKGIEDTARQFAAMVLQEGGLCSRGFDGPEFVTGDRHSGTAWFVVFCR